MRASPAGTREAAPGYEEEWNWNMLDPDVVLKTDDQVSLAEIWNVDESENICAHTDCPRDCENDEIAIKYENVKGSAYLTAVFPVASVSDVDATQATIVSSYR